MLLRDVGGRLTALQDLGLGGLGLGIDANPLALDLGLHDLIRLGRGLLARGAGQFGLLLGVVGFFQCAGLGNPLGGFGTAGGLGLLGGEIGVGLGNHRLGGVLAALGLGLRIGHPDGLLALGFCTTDGTPLILLGHLDLSVIDGLGGGFLTQRIDVARVVADVADVAVDHAQTNLVQLHLDTLGDEGDELLAVVVDLLDAH